jgi:hypothetical protein
MFGGFEAHLSILSMMLPAALAGADGYFFQG